MRIGEVAELTSLSFRTLRHYDEIGLATPSARTDGGFRLYTESDVARLMVVRRMKPLGYSLEEMSEVLAVVAGIRAAGGEARGADAPGAGAPGAGAPGTGAPGADARSAELAERLAEIRAEASARRDKLAAQVQMADEFLAQLAAPSEATEK
ncbi:MerR family transcriptional regulator [Microbacterium sp. ARD31]|nr:MerR family transcriptional regulator [Microbacterium sp. ARD31]MDT0182995.1 MerR family transcriptional regulator [Microbacterium sp. ARD31]